LAPKRDIGATTTESASIPLTGQALFVGPTMYASLSKNLAISAAWGVQVAGRAVDIPGSLDLKNFERHQAQLSRSTRGSDYECG
jgi:hypothetical protein